MIPLTLRTLNSPDAGLDDVIICDEEEQSRLQPSLQSVKEQFNRYREENEVKIRDLEQTPALLDKILTPKRMTSITTQLKTHFLRTCII